MNVMGLSPNEIRGGLPHAQTHCRGKASRLRGPSETLFRSDFTNLRPINCAGVAASAPAFALEKKTTGEWNAASLVRSSATRLPPPGPQRNPTRLDPWPRRAISAPRRRATRTRPGSNRLSVSRLAGHESRRARARRGRPRGHGPDRARGAAGGLGAGGGQEDPQPPRRRAPRRGERHPTSLGRVHDPAAPVANDQPPPGGVAELPPARAAHEKIDAATGGPGPQYVHGSSHLDGRTLARAPCPRP
jgi:hypothetical protein